MTKENVLSYLDEKLSRDLAEFDTAIDWDKKNHTFEVLVRLFAENKLKEMSLDVNETQSAEEILEIEDGVLFYHPEKSVFTPDYYLQTLAYQEKKGLTKGFLDAFVDYLKEVLEDGQGDLLDYATNPEVAEFSLKWQDEIFAQKVTEMEQKEGGTQYLPYPRY